MSINNDVTTLGQLESLLWEAANILRGPVDAADFKTYVFPLLFFKRISDVHDEGYAAALAESDGDAQWTNKDRLSDAMLRDLVEHFSALELTLANLPEDELGQGYEYLIKKFADDSGHTAAEFYTNRSAFTSDPWGRNRYGVPPQGRADYAFWQHILASLAPRTGRCAILFPHGVLFRQEEAEMRRKLIEADLIECVLGLGPNLFYNSPMEACVVICRTAKPKACKGRILFINAVGEVTRERVQSFLTDDHIERIVAAYRDFRIEPGFTRVATLVAEGIVNAVAHRDYASNASVEVQLFPDRLEIWNPGSVHPPLTLEKLYYPHASQPNNPLIAEPLFLTKYIEKAGTGTVDILERCRAAGMKQPEFRMDAGFFILTVWRKIPGMESVPHQDQVGTKSGPSRYIA